MNLLALIQKQIRAALAGLASDPAPYAAMVRPTQDPRHGDYQANCAMSLAKQLDRKPRDVAQDIATRIPLGDFLQAPEVAGPGFINLKLRDDWLAARLQELARDERLGVEKAAPARTIVIDYSSPNVAKPLHVGNLRSTIIGAGLVKLLRFVGHTVITDNHLGDWGTQFGILLYAYKHFRDEAALAADPVQEMLRLYRHVRQLMKPAEKEKEEGEESEPRRKYTPEEIAQAEQVAEAARQETAKLHAGDPENLELWQKIVRWSLEDLNRLYERLDVHFDHELGESFYNPQLPGVVADLEARGIARRSKGALAIFFSDDENEAPSLVQKRDGAFTYTTTDLATIRHRVDQWHADTILYVVGAPQALHFRNLFAAARRWGYDKVELLHITFGSVLDENRKMLRTREGAVAELAMLLDEAVKLAGIEYEETRAQRLARGEEVPELSPEERHNLEKAVGIGAVKYADLCQNRNSDYVFNLKKMVAMEGNTATYMQYAYVRNMGIFRKGDQRPERFRTAPPLPLLQTPQERTLAVALLRFGDAVDSAAAEYQPSVITAYLWDLAKTYSGFFQHCPVLKAPTPELRESRLLLCDLTARVIQKGLELLGIRTPERL